MAHTLASPARLGHSGRLQIGAMRLELDGTRIAANAGAIALNAAVLLLLLVPIALPPSAPQAERAPVIVWVTPEKKPDPVKVEVTTKPRVQPPTVVPQPRALPPQRDQPVVDSEPGDVWVPTVDPIEPLDPGDTIKPEPQPASTHLQAISSPPPSYPAEAIRKGLTGTVELEILVGVDGKPLEATVVRSSGHRVLDQAARKVVLAQWRFQPAVRDGREVQAIGRVPIVFTLER